MLPDKHVLFFDGVCGLCNRAVDFVLSNDPNQELLVAPLQGITAAELLPEEFRDRLDSLVLYNAEKIYVKSDAIFEILKLTRSRWRWARIFRFLPKVFLNWCYDIIARNRYRIFGKKETCRLPSPKERARFLD